MDKSERERVLQNSTAQNTPRFCEIASEGMKERSETSQQEPGKA